MSFSAKTLADRGDGSRWLTELRASTALRRTENTLPPSRLRAAARAWRLTGQLRAVADAAGVSYLAARLMSARLGWRTVVPCPARAPRGRGGRSTGGRAP